MGLPDPLTHTCGMTLKAPETPENPMAQPSFREGRQAVRNGRGGRTGAPKDIATVQARPWIAPTGLPESRSRTGSKCAGQRGGAHGLLLRIVLKNTLAPHEAEVNSPVASAVAVAPFPGPSGLVAALPREPNPAGGGAGAPEWTENVIKVTEAGLMRK
jgi:hypothetical protein